MIHILKAPETKLYLPQPTNTAWVKTRETGAEVYRLELLGEAPAIDMNTGCRNREPGLAQAKLSLLESGAILASFPLLGTLPGTIQSDPYTVWFMLDALATIPAGIFGKEIEIAPGRHLMTMSLGNWVVFFKPEKNCALFQKP